MGGAIKRRSAFFVAAGAIAAISLFSTPSRAYEAGKNCATETAGAPVVLKKFSKPQARANKRAYAGKSAVSRKSRASRQAATRNADVKKQDAKKPRVKEADASDKMAFGTKVDPATANAKAELLNNDNVTDNKAAEAKEVAPPAIQPASADPATAQATKIMAAEEFNDIDRTAWEQSPQPQLMKLAVMDSRAEIRADDSKWSQTSIIGKIFVAFGLLLTIGSAIRMFLA